MKRRRFMQIVVLGALAMLFFTSAQALAGGVKERMKARLPEILKLKEQGVIGENAHGFLEFVSSTKKKVNVVEDENADRRKVYMGIAKDQGTSPQLVGQRRAKQIAEKASSGQWLKGKNGKWHKKK